jgi:hypothetical protein
MEIMNGLRETLKNENVRTEIRILAKFFKNGLHKTHLGVPWIP